MLTASLSEPHCRETVAGREGVSDMGKKYQTSLIPILVFALTVITMPNTTVTAEESTIVTIKPREYSRALRNPLKGLRARKGVFAHEWATLWHTYIAWNQIENDENDGIDKIKTFCNQYWKDVEKYNIKVIPRVFLDWNEKEGNEYWPADMKTGDYSSEQFRRRVVRLVRRLGQLWDNDPRVAFVEMGIVGYWGEHHHPSPDVQTQKLLGDAFTVAFRNKKVTVRHPWEFSDYEFGIYWDSWGHIQQVRTHGEGIVKLNTTRSRWVTCPMGGECAYNWGLHQEQPGDNPNDTLLDPNHRNWLIDTIRWLHCTQLGWVADYDQKDPKVCTGAHEVQKAFGYRFILDKVCYSAKISFSKAFNVSFVVRNVGSAPFYYNWPVEVSLLDPKTRIPVWRDTFQDLDIRQWLPGDRWNKTTKSYELRPKSYRVDGTFRVPQTMGSGEYILALTILDPSGMLPSTRFAIENYFEGGRHPIGLVGVGKPVREPLLDPASFDDPAEDRTLQYNLDSRYTFAESPASLPLQEAAAIGNINLVRSLLDKGVGVDSWDDSAKKTALQCAAMSGHKDIVELLLSKGARIDAQEDWPGGTALDYAAEKGHKAIVELLIARGADINAKRGYPTGDMPLHSAARAGHKTIVELLIAKGTDVNAKNAVGETSLHYVARIGRKDILELLIANGADVDVKNELGQTPLDSAASRGQKEVVKLLIEKGAAVSTIHLAAYSGDLDKIKKFLEAGVDVNAKDQDGSIPLVMAVSGGHTDLVKYLIDKGADVKSTDESGWTSLHTAAEEGDKHIVEILIANGADVNAFADKWKTPLGVAARTGSTDVAEYLIAHGADVDAGEGYWTPLQEAAYYSKDMVELLLAKGANINIGKWTALHSALDAERFDIVELLLAKGADVNIKDGKGRTPLHIAAWYAAGKNTGIVGLLLSKGANLNAKDNNGKTALSYAIEHGHTEIAELLKKHVASIESTTIESKSVRLSPDSAGGLDDICDLILTGPSKSYTQFGNYPRFGDVNGDGYEDLLVAGASRYNNNTGRLYLYYGGKRVDNKPDKIFTGEKAGDYFGEDGYLADVNGDGYADVITSAFAYNNRRGRVYIFHGSPDIDENANLIIDGEPGTQGAFGLALTAGDVNNDAYDDVVITASSFKNKTGRVYLFYGGDPMDTAVDLIFDGENENDRFGRDINNPKMIGDVNGDGYGDPLLTTRSWNSLEGVNGSGRSYLYYGGPGTSMDSTCDKTFYTGDEDDHFGVSGCIFDIDNDGFADVIIGARGKEKVYLFWGGQDMDTIADQTIDGERGGQFGSGLDAGYVNGDEYGDIMVSAPYYTGEPFSGRAYLFYGDTKARINTTCDMTFTIPRNSGVSWAQHVALGDLHNDNYPDIALGGVMYNEGQGRVWIYFNTPQLPK